MRTLPAPWQNHRFLGTHRFEMTPFYFHGELYLLENFVEYNPADYPPEEYPPRTVQDGFRIRRLRDDAVIGEPVRGNYFASAFVWQDKVYVFAALMSNPMFHRLARYESSDLVHWSAPKVVWEADVGCMLFNIGVVWNGEKFVMVYETDTPEHRQKYIFQFLESQNLNEFRKIPNAVYGLDKYVGGCSLYYINKCYYALYVNDRLDGTYDTRVCRSADLRQWQDGQRPLMTPDLSHEINPACPGRMELNASDMELVEADGKTLGFWLGGDQHGTCDMQMAEYPGTLQSLLEFYFK